MRSFGNGQQKEKNKNFCSCFLKRFYFTVVYSLYIFIFDSSVSSFMIGRECFFLYAAHFFVKNNRKVKKTINNAHNNPEDLIFMGILNVLLQAVASFIVLFIISKLLGKKQVAQLEFIDYVVGISIGSIAAEMAFEPKIPFYHFIMAMVVFGGLDLAFTLLARKANFFKALFKGKPLILIENGKINFKNLKRSKLDVNDLIAQCRAQGYFKLADIAYCVFENSGDFSILSKSGAKPLSPDDLQLQLPSAKLEIALVVDGKVNSDALSNIDKNQTWLFEKLNIKDGSELRNIILATYDQDEDRIEIHTKEQ